MRRKFEGVADRVVHKRKEPTESAESSGPKVEVRSNYRVYNRNPETVSWMYQDDPVVAQEIAVTTDEGDFVIAPIPSKTITQKSPAKVCAIRGIDYLKSPTSYKNIYDKPYIVSPFKNIENVFNVRKPIKVSNDAFTTGIFKTDVPNILRKRKRAKDEEEMICESGMTRSRAHSPPPSVTPIKPLPFSPSQFFNSPATERVLSSTPMKSGGFQQNTSMLSTPIVMESVNIKQERDFDTKTPLKSKMILDLASDSGITRTPTPFKNAMAEVHRRRGSEL